MTSGGLDLAALRGVRAHATRDVGGIRRRIEDHLEAHDGYLALSAGKDSLVALHLTLAVEPNVPICYFDSHFDYPESYRYLDELAERWRLNLDVIPAQHRALEVLQASGAWDHTAPDQSTPALGDILISEPAAIAHGRYGAGEIWGVRAEESRGRAAAYSNALRAETCSRDQDRRSRHGGLIRRLDGTVAYGPIWDWRAAEVWGYIAHHQLPVNPVYAKLRALGAPEHMLRVSHIIDGSRLEQGRATWLRRGWPALFEELCAHLPRLREFV